ncbi:MAG: FRG domain-containing protein [Acidobacteriota bacterium]|nr:FRG domain-containing protein [Acidobacteriota bacterium]
MYARVTIADWHTTLKTIGGIYPRWIFRGQPSARWGLETTLERAAVAKNSAFASSADHLAVLINQAIAELPGREEWILHQFRRRAHLVMPSAPPEDSLLDWLAAIQHFGGPTRLLDFTHSFYVAVFFALERASEDAAVWGLYAPHLESRCGIGGDGDHVGTINERAVRLVEKALRGSIPCTGVVNVEPYRLNERMSVQKGVFALPLEITKPFMQSLSETFDFDFTEHDHQKYEMSVTEFLSFGLCRGPLVVKFVLPRIVHQIALGDLAAMNIDASTLFPGLEGYARSMYRHF